MPHLLLYILVMDGKEILSHILGQQTSCVFELQYPNGEIFIANTLSEAADYVGVSVDTITKHLDYDTADSGERSVVINNHKVKRVCVF